MPLDAIETYGDLMKRYGYIPANHHTPNFFDVESRPVYDSRGREIPGHIAISRNDTGDTMAIHSDGYKLIPYKVGFDKFDQCIIDAGIVPDFNDVMVSTDLTHNGARCFRQYLFPKITMEIVGELIALRIISFNSYDGSMAQSFQAGFFNFVCANTSVHGKTVASLRVKHTGNALERFENGAAAISHRVAEWMENRGRMERWGDIEISAYGFSKIVDEMPQGTQSLSDHLVARFASSDKPKTLWTAYNVLTAWSTHTDTGTSGFAATKAAREKRVAALVDGRMWQDIEQE